MAGKTTVSGDPPDLTTPLPLRRMDQATLPTIVVFDSFSFHDLLRIHYNLLEFTAFGITTYPCLAFSSSTSSFGVRIILSHKRVALFCSSV